MKLVTTAKYLKPQRGAAFTEMLVLMIVMIPLAYSIPMLGKMLDLRHTTIMASRYLAWEEAKGPAASADSRTPDVVGSRFYLAPDSAIQTLTDTEARQSGVTGANPLWGERGPTNRNTTPPSDTNLTPAPSSPNLWSRMSFDDSVAHMPDAMYASTGARSLGGAAGSVADSIATAGGLLNFASGVNWDLEGGEYSKGEVSVQAHIGNLMGMVGSGCQSTSSPDPGADMPAQSSDVDSACFHERNAMFVDSWSASSERQVKRRTRGLVPASVLEPVGQFLSHFGRLPVVEELKGLEHAFGHVDVSVLPSGRSLGTYPE